MKAVYYVSVLCQVAIFQVAADHTRGYHAWSHWSSCSTTCGDGIRTRGRRCKSNGILCSGSEKESKHCNLQFCPSYLGWPRIHFTGKLAADVSTVNNIRCAYENKEFYPAELSKHYIGVAEKTTTHTWYKRVTGNWNPDGSNQIYFVDTYVTSYCSGPRKCSTSASVVGLKVIEATRGVMAVLDVDWQLSTEIWGLKIRIPGVLEGTFGVSSHQVQGTRVDKRVDKSVGYAVINMSRYKSKLYNITWNDDYYREQFSNATELSISFAYDLFNQVSLCGRVTGTVGLTSDDDAKQTVTSRVLQGGSGIAGSKGRGSAPFFVHYPQKLLTLDFSYSLGSRQNGSFLASDYGELDLVLLLTGKEYCKYYPRDSYCTTAKYSSSLTWKSLTKGGEVSRKVGHDNVWYSIYGGLLDFDLSHLDHKTLKLLKSTRMAIKTGTEDIYMMEYPNGINMGLKDDTIFRLSEGESEVVHGFVSSFGRPVKNAQFAIYAITGSQASTHCERSTCNSTMGVPLNSLGISSAERITLTNGSGLATNILSWRSDPGNVRGCGLDGQVYPLQLFLRYSKRGKSTTFSDSGYVTKGRKHTADFYAHTQNVAVQLYQSVPKISCPTWNDDLKEIFVQYYNLYPVMWKSGIIDLHSYNGIKRRSKMLKAAMFDTDRHDPRYMPISRDLSNGKRDLIWNWLKCGMPRNSNATKRKETVCSDAYISKGLSDVRVLLNQAIMLELTTIPPYVNSWLSLKTEFGRNKEIADIIKSVFNEEMLHMSLGGNLLNAIGGVVNMTDESKLPMYPTILATGDSYELCPDVQVGLFPFSLGLVQDVFSKIEEPSDFETRQFIRGLGEIWKRLPARDGEGSSNMKRLVEELKNSRNSSISENVALTVKKLEELLLENWRELWNYTNEQLRVLEGVTIKTVGSFYSLVALKLTSLESCTRMRALEEEIQSGAENSSSKLPESIFTGDPTHQLNISHWYQQSDDAVLFVMDEIHKSNEDYVTTRTSDDRVIRPPLFEVTDLKTALEAIVDIVYQGEGGSDCTPLVTEPLLYASERGRDKGHELSHYYRFQEISHGRKLVKIQNPPPWSDWDCLNRSDTTVCRSLSGSNEDYCYAGDKVTFYEDGVWPMIFNPKEKYYTKDSKAYRLNEQFNLLYTRLLFCIQESFGGNPERLKTCMSIMYDMTITGKRLAQTPLHMVDATERSQIETTGKNGAPTWRFKREKPYKAGFPLRG